MTGERLDIWPQTITVLFAENQPWYTDYEDWDALSLALAELPGVREAEYVPITGVWAVRFIIGPSGKYPQLKERVKEAALLIHDKLKRKE